MEFCKNYTDGSDICYNAFSTWNTCYYRLNGRR